MEAAGIALAVECTVAAKLEHTAEILAHNHMRVPTVLKRARTLDKPSLCSFYSSTHVSLMELR